MLTLSGITLSASQQSETWDPEAKATYPRSNKLLIRQALLGPDAKPDELNVVQVSVQCNIFFYVYVVFLFAKFNMKIYSVNNIQYKITKLY